MGEMSARQAGAMPFSTGPVTSGFVPTSLAPLRTRCTACLLYTSVRMEEARARALPLASAFSRNALEERIGAIMNVKKRSVVALLTALLITAVSLAAFAAAPVSETTSQAVGAAYEAFGLRREEDGLAYCSVSVRLFADDAAGIASLDPRGNIDVYAVRDGSGL